MRLGACAPSPAGSLPAVGWIVASFVLAMPSSHGSVIITNTTAGKWYLYGGALAAVGGRDGRVRALGPRPVPPSRVGPPPLKRPRAEVPA